MSKVFILRKKNTIRVNGHIGELRGKERVPESHILESVWITFMGHFFPEFTLASHFDLPGSTFGVSQEPPVWVHTSLSRDDAVCRGLWVARPSALLILTSKEPSAYVWSGRSPDSENKKYVVWAGPSPLSECPAVLILEFRSAGNEPLIALPWRVGIYFLLQYKERFGKFILCEKVKKMKGKWSRSVMSYSLQPHGL